MDEANCEIDNIGKCSHEEHFKKQVSGFVISSM